MRTSPNDLAGLMIFITFATWAITLAVHVAFALAVWNDAQNRETTGAGVVFVGSLFWMLATLLGGVLTAAPLLAHPPLDPPPHRDRQGAPATLALRAGVTRPHRGRSGSHLRDPSQSRPWRKSPSIWHDRQSILQTPTTLKRRRGLRRPAEGDPGDARRNRRRAGRPDRL